MFMGGDEEIKTEDIESLQSAALDTTTHERFMIDSARDLFKLQIK